MKPLFPAIEAVSSSRLPVSSYHQLYFETCGNPAGIPVVFLHGGPGSGCQPYHRSFFDPNKYWIVLMDQRGAGRSSPAGEVRENTTADLIEDLEQVRIALGVERWLLFGGSWGAALALLYASKYPASVSGMILRGSFLARRRDLEWYLLDGGANRLFPESWEALVQFAPGQNLEASIARFHDILHGTDEITRLRLARAWSAWGAQLALGDAFEPSGTSGRSPDSLLHQVAIELHYASHCYFIRENQILAEAEALPDVPTVIVHGRHDFVCPVDAALQLHRQLPGSELRIVARAGHVANSPEMIDALVTATDDMATRLSA